MKYLKLFKNHSQYEDFVSGGTMVKPNVSHCVSENHVHYNPFEFLVGVFNITGGTTNVMLFGDFWEEIEMPTRWIADDSEISELIVDGKTYKTSELYSTSGSVEFSEGVHVVKYVLSDITKIPDLHNVPINEIHIPSHIEGLYLEYLPRTISHVSVDERNQILDSRDDCDAIVHTETNTVVFGCENTSLPATLSGIGGGAFSGCLKITSVTIPGNIKNIGDYAFSYCERLTSVTLNEGVEILYHSVFEGCDGLTNVVIPNSVKTLGNNVFCFDNSLTSVTIGSGIETIGREVFRSCNNLTTVTIMAEVPPTLETDTFSMWTSNPVTLYVKPGFSEIYRSAWGSTLPNNVSIVEIPMVAPIVIS